MATRVKICGITRPEDAALAAELGADAIGLNFVAGPRKITSEIARAILAAIAVPDLDEPMPHFTRAPIPVALCHAPSREVYRELWPTELQQTLGVTRFQIYGQDTMQLLPKLRQNDAFVQLWDVARLGSHEDLAALIESLGPGGKFYESDAVVVDAATGQQLGGTGKTFDWKWFEEIRSDVNSDEFSSLILAGGLTPDNVAEAIRIARPYAVDVSSGVEISGKPGVKDPVKMRAFIQAAKQAL